MFPIFYDYGSKTKRDIYNILNYGNINNQTYDINKYSP